MPSKVFDTVWEAEPHTVAKIAILKAYLHAWFPILGRSKGGQPILYVDGFAGPGEYKNHPDGSPIAAVTAATTAIDSAGTKWIAGTVNCFFIEEDDKRCDNLKARLSRVVTGAKVKAQVLNSRFEVGIAKVKAAMPSSFQRPYPLFVFIDPFGATGVPFSAVAEILQSPCSEVLINLDVDGAARIFKAREAADSNRLLGELFGDDSWRTALTAQNDFRTLCRQVLELYKSKLRSLPKVKYVFPFEMRDSNDSLSYCLVFASQEPLGLEKMKEAMKSIDKSGSYSFSDGHINQNTLFRFDDPKKHAEELHRRRLGQNVPAADLRDYALLETPFTNAKAMLRELENRNILEITSSKPNRRSGDFSEDSLISVTFLPEKPVAAKQIQKGLFDG